MGTTQGCYVLFFKKIRKQNPIKQQLYGHLPLILQAVTRHLAHCWKSKDKLISDVLLWTPTHRISSVGQLSVTYIHQFCVDTGWSLEDPSGVMDGKREGERGGILCSKHDLMMMMIDNVSWPTGAEDDPKALFSIATTPKC